MDCSQAFGCIDTLACNYNPISIYSDSSCIFPSLNQQSFSICDGDNVVVGNSVYNTTGNYTDTLNASNGCDSIVYTYIAVDQNTSSYDTLSVIASIVWNGIPLNISGDYSFTLTNSLGCDSIANLNLTITTSGIVNLFDNKNKKILRIINVLGGETKGEKNEPLSPFKAL